MQPAGGRLHLTSQLPAPEQMSGQAWAHRAQGAGDPAYTSSVLSNLHLAQQLIAQGNAAFPGS